MLVGLSGPTLVSLRFCSVNAKDCIALELHCVSTSRRLRLLDGPVYSGLPWPLHRSALWSGCLFLLEPTPLWDFSSHAMSLSPHCFIIFEVGVPAWCDFVSVSFQDLHFKHVCSLSS